MSRLSSRTCSAAVLALFALVPPARASRVSPEIGEAHGITTPVIVDPASGAWAEQVQPRAASNGLGSLVVWSERDAAGFGDIRAARLAPDGTVLDPDGFPVYVGPGDQRVPDVVWDGTSYFVVWESRLLDAGDVYGIHVGADGAVLDPAELPIAVGWAQQGYPSVETDGERYLVAWHGYPATPYTGAEAAIYATAVTRAGEVQTPGGFPLVSAPYGQAYPDIAHAAGSGTFLVVWGDHRRTPPQPIAGSHEWPPYDVYGARLLLDAAGAPTLLDSFTGSLPIHVDELCDRRPRVASDGTGFLVIASCVLGGSTWDGTSFRMSAVAHRVDALGTISGPIDVSGAVGDAWGVQVAYTAPSYLVTWLDGATGPTELRARRVSSAGAILDANATLVALDPRFVLEPPPPDGRLLFTSHTTINQTRPGEALVTYAREQTPGGTPRVRGRLVHGGTVVAWGVDGTPLDYIDYGQADVPAELSDVISVAAGFRHSVALHGDGTVFAWGLNDRGQADVPAGLAGVVAIAAGYDFSAALRSDGTVVAWGNPEFDHTNVPAGLTGVVDVDALSYHTVALRSDGTVVAWGENWQGQRAVPAGLSDVVDVAAGGHHSVALRRDGTVVAWGNDEYGQLDVPAGLSGVVAIDAGHFHTVALRSDGSVVAWGWAEGGRTDVPAGLSGVVAIAAGTGHTLALRGDGTVVAWGDDAYGQATVPGGLHAVSAVAAGGFHSLAVGEQSFELAIAKAGAGAGSVTSTPAGVDCGATCTAAFDAGTMVSLAAAAAPGSAFAGWSGACTGSGACTVTMDAAKGITATFEPAPVPYALTVTKAGTGSGRVTSAPSAIDCGATCTSSFAASSHVTLTAVADPGSIFTTWTTSCTGTGTCSVTMNSAKTVGARFDPAAFTLTTSLAGAGKGTVSATDLTPDPDATLFACTAGSCSASVPSGHQVALVPTPDPGFLFTGWTGTHCRGTVNPCLLALDAAKAVTAGFQPAEVPLSVTPTGTGAGTVTGGPIACTTGSSSGCGAMVPYNSSVTLTAAPAPGSIFKRWEGVAGCSTSPSCTVSSIRAAKAVDARFEPATFRVTVSMQGPGTGTVSRASPAFTCEKATSSPTTCTFDADNGTTVSLSAAPTGSSTFRGWGVVCTGTASCSFTINSDKTVWASFDPGP